MEGTQGGSSHVQEPMPLRAMLAKEPDKSRRDEWSKDGVLSLLDIYESKWILRNRAKLKGSDWEDVARQVSICSLGIKALKTPNQCKNKIESMKKRYRAEAAASNPLKHSSSWQFFVQMDRLLKGAPNCMNQPMSDNNIHFHGLPKAEANVEVEEHVQCSYRDDGSNTMLMDLNANNVNDNQEKEDNKSTDSNVSADKPAKTRKGSGSGLAESIQLFGHSMLKIEEARMEMYKDLERMRAEVEIKRSEIELKRTEIVANTQLQIAKLLMKKTQTRRNRSRSSGLADGMDVLPRREAMVSHFIFSFMQGDNSCEHRLFFIFKGKASHLFTNCSSLFLESSNL